MKPREIREMKQPERGSLADLGLLRASRGRDAKREESKSSAATMSKPLLAQILSKKLFQVVYENKRNDKVKEILEKNDATVIKNIVNWRTSNGITMLAQAASNGNFYVVNLLLTYGADPNIVDLAGWSPLMRAVRINKLDIVRILLRETRNLNQVEKHGVTALGLAVLNRNKDIIFELLNAGANPFMKNKQGIPLSLVIIQMLRVGEKRDYERFKQFLQIAVEIEKSKERKEMENTDIPEDSNRHTCMIL